jgi:DNA-binding NtrC family response regulator
LRERGDDALLLARHFAARFGKELRRREANLSDAALATLRSYDWPGNVRELENAIERACILADSLTLEPSDLGLHARLRGDARHDARAEWDYTGTLAEAAERAARHVERRKIADALRAQGGNKTRAAEELGVSYKTLLTKIKEYDL